MIFVSQTLRCNMFVYFRFVLDIFKLEGRSEDSSLVDDIPLHAPDVMMTPI